MEKIHSEDAAASMVANDLGFEHPLLPPWLARMFPSTMTTIQPCEKCRARWVFVRMSQVGTATEVSRAKWCEQLLL